MTTKTYLQAVFGDTEGVAHMAIGSGGHYNGSGRYEFTSWAPATFTWPAEAETMLRAIGQEVAAGSDVYVAPYLMHGSRRAKGAAVTRQLVHADIDHGHLDVEKVRELGGFAVASGTPGNGHAYVALSEPVGADVHEALCRGLGTHLGGADAKVSDNDVLRPPGTINGKSDPPTPVSWLVEPTGRSWAPQELADALGVDLHRPKPTAPALEVGTVDVAALPQRVRDALALDSGDRSADTMRVVGACVDAGLDLPTTRAAVADRPDLAARLAERADDDVWTCWAKITAERAERQQQRAREAEYVAELVGGAVSSAVDEQDEDAAERARRVFPRIDWHELWADDEEDEWLHEPLLPARRSVVIYSPPKVGKSLLVLEFAVALTRAALFLGHQIERRHRVLYIDFENDPRGDVRSRLQAMGYGPNDLDHLDYLSFPTMAGLDTERGSLELLEAVKAYGSEVVIIDTVSRAVDGEENSNDTWLGLYRHTGLKLKQAGVAVVRLDHTGKDESKGQRGGSAKSGDVDAVWRLTKITDERFRLECTDARMQVATKSLHLIRERTPRLRHTSEVLGALTTREAKIAHIVELADSNGLPAGTSRRDLQEFAKERGIGGRNDLFNEAAKARRAAAEVVPEVGDHPSGTDWSPPSGTSETGSPEEPRDSGEKSGPHPPGTSGDHPPSPHWSPGQQSLAAPVGTTGPGEQINDSSDTPETCAKNGCDDPARPDKQMCAMHRTSEPAGVHR